MSQAVIQTKPSAHCGAEWRGDAWRAIAVSGILVLAVALVFGRTLSHGFLGYDDSIFIYAEPHVSGGLSWSGIAWAFTNGPLGEWYPLSMLSHMLDCQLYGLNPAGHHLSNVLLHAAATVVLFLALWRMTEGLWPSAMVAALFAIHPLHVESVAWMAERRDVLSGLFFMLTLGAYGEYVRHPQSLARYLAVVGFFALGLLSKSMLVTLPPLLLLLDYWPLGRFRRMPPDSVAPSLGPAPFPWRVVVDKLPLVALALADGGVTMLTHGLRPDRMPISERLANAAVSCIAYVGQLFVPMGLSPYYAHPEAGRPVWHVAAAAVLLLATTVGAVLGCRKYPYLFVGWFWYLGMLVPVLGLTYVGGHARADRYTYLSQIGLYMALVWGAMRLGASWPVRRWIFSIGSALTLAALMACAWRQTGFWQDSKTLWEHALACDPKNVMAHYALGRALCETDETGGMAQFQQALALGPNERNIYYATRASVHCALGAIAEKKGDAADAIAQYRQALESDSDCVPAHTELGRLLAKMGDFDQAMVHFQRGIDLEPDNATVYRSLAVALAQAGKTDEAIANFRKALAIDPSLFMVHTNVANLLTNRGEVDEAMVQFRQAIEIDPDVIFPYYQVAQLLRKQGKTSQAAEYEERGLKARRRYAEALNLRGTELAQQGETDKAIAQFQTAIAVLSDYAPAHCRLADALAKQGKTDEAIAQYRQALEIDPNLAPAKQSLYQLLHQ